MPGGGTAAPARARGAGAGDLVPDDAGDPAAEGAALRTKAAARVPHPRVHRRGPVAAGGAERGRRRGHPSVTPPLSVWRGSGAGTPDMWPSSTTGCRSRGGRRSVGSVSLTVRQSRGTPPCGRGGQSVTVRQAGRCASGERAGHPAGPTMATSPSTGSTASTRPGDEPAASRSHVGRSRLSSAGGPDASSELPDSCRRNPR
jgi:hypothetical protein